MKKLIYTLATTAIVSLAGCNGTNEYDNYVETLKAQTAAVDTISSAQSYAAFLETIANDAVAFADKDVKLDDTQKKEMADLSNRLQQALTAKYEQLAQTPMTLPSDFLVEETDTVAVAD